MPSVEVDNLEIHKILLSNNIFILENLKNLERLLYINKIIIMALPLKIDSEASYTRAIALY